MNRQPTNATTLRVAARHVQAAYFGVGDIVLMGKYKNKRGQIVAFGRDKWGNPTVEVAPIPQGRKQTKVFGLFKIWRADVKEGVLRQQAEEQAKLESRVADVPFMDDDDAFEDWDDEDEGDHDFAD